MPDLKARLEASEGLVKGAPHLTPPRGGCYYDYDQVTMDNRRWS